MAEEHENIQLGEYESLQAEEELRPDQAVSLRDIFGSKMVELSSMNRIMRFVTGLGIAQIVAAALLIWLNLMPMKAVALHHADGTVSVSVPVPVLIGSLFFLLTAWTWLVVGALHSRKLFRLPVLLLFFVLHAQVTLSWPGARFSWLALALIAGYVLWRAFRPSLGYGREAAVVGSLLLLLYGSLAFSALVVERSGELVTLIISLQIMMISLLLQPLLVFAGLDLGESVRDITRWVIGMGAARSSVEALFWTALTLLSVKLVWLIAIGSVGWSWLLAGAFLVLAGYLTVRLRPWEGLHLEPQFGMLFVMAVGAVLSVVLYAIIRFALGLSGNDPSGMYWTWGLPGVVAAIVALILALRPRTTSTRTAATFLMLFAGWALIRCVGTALGTDVSPADIDGAAAILLLLLLLLLRRGGLATRSLSAWAISLTIGLSVIRLMILLVQNNFEIPAAAAAAQVLVLAVGLLWDVITSGDRWTNGDSPRMPRFSRIFLYFGYVAMTITAILYFKGTQMTETFNEDDFAVAGLLVLGIPVYLYGFARAGVLLVRQAHTQIRESTSR